MTQYGDQEFQEAGQGTYLDPLLGESFWLIN